MAMDKDCPCTIDCPDRPNCKGCEKFKAYKQKKLESYQYKSAEQEFKSYQMETFNKAMKRADRFKRGNIK